MLRTVFCTAVGLAFAAGVACAQTTGPMSKWEIEGYGGLPIGSVAGPGTHVLPPPGASITTASFQFPSHLVPSWFFGDGAAMLNNASTELGLTTHIAPLDEALGDIGLASRQFHAGVRVRRTLTNRYTAEVGFDFGRSPREFSSAVNDAIAAARDSFTSAFTSLLASGPFTGSVVDATSTTTRGSGREWSLTGALNMSLRRYGRWAPYATFGGGVLTHSGTLPSTVLQGDYRALILNSVPIHETDRVTLRVAGSAGTAPLVVFGGGVHRDFTDRWGLRADARLQASSGTRLLIDASPLIVQATPAGFIESLTNPDLQFSNNTSTGRLSTLGGQLSGFEAANEGVRMRILISVGITRRF